MPCCRPFNGLTLTGAARRRKEYCTRDEPRRGRHPVALSWAAGHGVAVRRGKHGPPTCFVSFLFIRRTKLSVLPEGDTPSEVATFSCQSFFPPEE